MQLARFDGFLTELERDDGLNEIVESFQVYRFWKETWFNTMGEPFEGPLSASLMKTLDQDSHWRERNSCDTFFPVSELNCVVIATFCSPPRKPTRDKFSHRLGKVLENAMNAFDATHDGLTGLLNRSAFEDCLRDEISTVAERAAEAEQAADVISARRMLSLLALDADHFKQVNDTFGHIYGDIVLACLATRLEKTARTIEKEGAGAVRVHVARPSGEEFLMLLAGDLGTEQCLDIAEQVRTAVAEETLPSDIELEEFPDKSKLASVTIPDLSNRTVTVSLGVACAAVLRDGQEEKIGGELHAQADTALYYAKAGGRNAVRYFDSILNKYGSVLEHHIATSTVAIDLGRKLKVKVGQEFLVFHPDFTGSKPFLHSDGRTQKRLGVYPRVPMARLVVFDVQDEISFCSIAEYQVEGAMPSGATLEAVPLGSISHLITKEYNINAFREPNLITIDALSALVDDDASNGRTPFVIVFSLHDSDSVIEARGTAFVNEALAGLFQVMKQEFPPSAMIAQIRTTEFALHISSLDYQAATTAMRKTLDAANGKCRNLAWFSAGYYCNSFPKETELEGDKSDLKPTHTLEYARYAASLAGKKAAQLLRFGPNTARIIMQDSRERQLYEKAAKDHKRFVEIGVQYAYVENVRGLCALEMEPQDLKLAVKAFEEAVELLPGSYILWQNLGLTHFEGGDRDAAAPAFFRAAQLGPDDKILRRYLVPFALSLHQYHQTHPEKIDVPRIRNLLLKAAEAISASVADVSPEEIQEALSDIETMTS